MNVSLPRWLNLYRRYPHWARAKCIFVHVPKAAGTSMNHALYGRTLGHYSIAEIRKAFPRLVDASFVFSIVRCPFTRLYSAYRFAKAGRTADMGVVNPSQYEIPEFKTFERFVLDWLPNQPLHHSDHIFRPQHSYVCIDDEIAVDQLIRIEELPEAVPELERRLGRTLHLRSRNVTGGDLDDDRYTPEMRDIAVMLYDRDFELFGYARTTSTRGCGAERVQ